MEFDKLSLEDVMAALPHPFYIIDVETHEILAANEAALQGLPWTPGLTCHALTHHLDHPCEGEDDPCPGKVVCGTGKPVTVEHRHYLPDGNLGIFEVHGYPIKDEPALRL